MNTILEDLDQPPIEVTFYSNEGAPELTFRVVNLSLEETLKRLMLVVLEPDDDEEIVEADADAKLATDVRRARENFMAQKDALRSV